MSIIYDLLRATLKPLHVSEIIKKAKIDFNVDLDRDSFVSAISEKLKADGCLKGFHRDLC